MKLNQRGADRSLLIIFIASFTGIAVVGPPSKRPNKDPMPSHRPTPEQYAAMMAAAAAAGQPLPRHHVRLQILFSIFFPLSPILLDIFSSLFF